MNVHGVIEFEIDGKKRGLKFDQYGLMVAARKDDCSLSEFFTRVLTEKDPLSFVHLMYGTAVAYNESKGRRLDFTVDDMYSWIEQVGAERMSEYIKEGLSAPEAKN